MNFGATGSLTIMVEQLTRQQKPSLQVPMDSTASYTLSEIEKVRKLLGIVSFAVQKVYGHLSQFFFSS